MTGTRTRPCGLIGISLAVAIFAGLAPDAQADIGPPVEIKMAPDTHQAVAGEEYNGTFEVRIFRPGQLLRFEISGEGWTILSAEFPDEPHDAEAGVLRIPFRAIPVDADSPILLTLTFNGRRVAQAYEIGPGYFGSAGKSHRSAQVQGSPTPVVTAAEAASAGPAVGDGSGSSPARGGGLQVVGRIAYMRDGKDQSNPPDGDTNDPEDIQPLLLGADNIDVRIWDSDPIGHEEIWSGLTDENGYFDTGVVQWDDGGDDPDLVLYYETETGVVDVTDNSLEEWTYTFESEEVEDFTGSFYDFGTHAPELSSLHPALHLFNTVVRTHRFINEKPGYITPSVQVEWPDNSNNSQGAWYEDDSNEIHVSVQHEWNNAVVSHEYGHHFMDSLYDPDLPPPDYCFDPSCDSDNANGDCSHCDWCQETGSDAWKEGWSDWLASIVTDDYEDRYTVDLNGPPLVSIYRWVFSPLESLQACGDSGMVEDPVMTEEIVAAMLFDMEDANQDDHDDDLDPDVVSMDGIYDMLCLGPNEIFWVMDIYAPVTIVEFINAFITEFPEHTGNLRATAFNVGGDAYVAGFPADTDPPGVVVTLDSPTHPIGIGASETCLTFEWDPAFDDATGAGAYSYFLHQDPGGIEPDEGADLITLTDHCKISARTVAWELGDWYFSIKARDNAGTWSNNWETFGPFEILDCNDSGLLDICDIDCLHQGDPDGGICTFDISPCIGLPECGTSADCNDNDSPDECDIADGTSEDCNKDGIPDECQLMKHFTGAFGPEWGLGGNWAEAAIPVDDEHVCIPATAKSSWVEYSAGETLIASLSCDLDFTIAGSTLEIDGPSFIMGNLSVDGTLTNNDDLQVDGFLTWIGGTISGPGSTTVAGGMSLPSDSVVLGANHHLTISGGAVDADDQLMTMLGSSVLTIGADVTYTYSGDFRIFDGGTSTTVDIDGTLLRSSLSGDVQLYSFVDNSGLIHNQVGELILQYGGLHSGDVLGDPGTILDFRGTHEFLAGSSLICDEVEFISATSNFRGAVDIAGMLTVDSGGENTFTDEANVTSYGQDLFVRSGKLHFEAPVAAPSLEFDSVTIGETGLSGAMELHLDTGQPISIDTLSLVKGAIDGVDPITINNSFTWNSGSLYSGGDVVCNGPMTVDSNGNTRDLHRDFYNAAYATFVSGAIGVQSGAVFYNTSSGTIDSVTDATIFSSGAVDNAGLLVKSAGTGISIFSLTDLTNTGTVEIQTGVLQVGNGDYIQTAGQTILNGGDLEMWLGVRPVELQGGTLTGAGTVMGDVDNSGGEVAPGLSAGTIQVDGYYTQGASAKLTIEIGGTSQGVDFDWLDVTETATLAGELEVELTGGYLPPGGASFEILSAAVVSGVFDAVTFIGFPAELQAQVVYTADTVRVDVVSAVPGDCNQSGVVDLTDFADFQACHSGPGGGLGADCDCFDFDEDGDVDLLDFSAFETWFGS